MIRKSLQGEEPDSYHGTFLATKVLKLRRGAWSNFQVIMYLSLLCSSSFPFSKKWKLSCPYITVICWVHVWGEVQMTCIFNLQVSALFLSPKGFYPWNYMKCAIHTWIWFRGLDPKLQNWNGDKMIFFGSLRKR